MKISGNQSKLAALAAIILFETTAATQLPEENVPVLWGECISCHKQKEAPHIQEWQDSIHARSQVTCISCHEQHAKYETGGARAVKAPRLSARKKMIERCGGCHSEVMDVYRKSTHYRKLLAGELAPDCAACHEAVRGKLLHDAHIQSHCRKCHNGIRPGSPNIEVPELALKLLRSLRETALKQAIVNEQLRQLPGNPAAEQYREQVKRIDARFKGIAVEWHRFDLVNVQREVDEISLMLEKIHDNLTELPPKSP
jgi:hypothetical protein